MVDRYDIIKMAKEAGLYSGSPRSPSTGRMIEKRLKRFAELVAAAEQEPVAFINVEEQKLEWAKLTLWHTPTVVKLPKIPLYTAPPKREWVGLTGNEARKFYEKYTDREELIHAIDKFLEEKNNG